MSGSAPDWMTKVRCRPEQQVLFFRQLAIMFSAGVPLVVALDTLSDQPERPNFGEAVLEMARRLEHGYSFSRSVALFPRAFNKIHVAMITMGERTGALAECLERVADWGERDYGLYRDVKGALTYPLLVLGMAVVLTLVLFLTVVPGFVSMFEDREMELPVLTQIVVFLTKLVTNPGAWVLALGSGLLLYLSLRATLRTTTGAARLYSLVSLLPAVGSLLRFGSAARYTSVLGTLLDSGLDLLASLRLAAVASGNPHMEIDARRVIEEIQHGGQLTTALAQKPDIYPYHITEMVGVGEETSNLSEMLIRTSIYMDQEMAHKVEELGAVLEPITLLLVSGIVGSILLAVIMPLYSFLNQLGI
jgi:type IV pilus assembly protein PilC